MKTYGRGGDFSPIIVTHCTIREGLLSSGKGRLSLDFHREIGFLQYKNQRVFCGFSTNYIFCAPAQGAQDGVGVPAAPMPTAPMPTARRRVAPLSVRDGTGACGACCRGDVTPPPSEEKSQLLAVVPPFSTLYISTPRIPCIFATVSSPSMRRPLAALSPSFSVPHAFRSFVKAFSLLLFRDVFPSRRSWCCRA